MFVLSGSKIYVGLVPRRLVFVAPIEAVVGENIDEAGERAFAEIDEWFRRADQVSLFGGVWSSGRRCV